MRTHGVRGLRRYTTGAARTADLDASGRHARWSWVDGGCPWGWKMRNLRLSSAAPARKVQAASTPTVKVLRGLVARATTPLLPDDYLKLLNPLWSARELRGLVIDVHRETEDSATVTIKPGWGFSGDFQPGQYLGIGLRVGGRWHWRSYSLTSLPRRDKKLIAITVKATPEGFLSSHLVNGVEPGTVVRLAAPRGDFALPDPPPAKLLFVTAGSGITPVIAMLRSLRQRGESPDIMHVHSAHAAGDVIFHDELLALERTQPDYRLHLQLTADMGKVDFAALDGLVPDWKDRSTWACGPTAMLDIVEKVWTEAGMRDKLHTERFAIARTDNRRRGRHRHFQDLGHEHQTRRCDNADGRRREARHPDAVRMPDGYLPILCIAAGIGLRARSQVWNRTLRGRSNPDMHLRSIRRLHHRHLGRHLGARHGHHRHQPVRTPHRGRHRGIGPLSDFVLDQHLPIPAEQGAATSFFEASIINLAVEPSSARATRPSKPSGTSSLRVPTPVSVDTPSACASWPGPMRGSRSSGVVSVRLGTQPVRDEVSRPPLISKSNSSRRTRR